MGIMSRQVLPVCAPLCCCLCPGMRARSKKPIKRYNQFLAAIFKSAEEGEVNDKQIGKLAEYASENPDRIPVILDKLEERVSKDLPAGRYFAVASITRSHSKMMVECREHMPLIAGPVLGLSQKLLDSRSPEMRCLGCQSAASFLSSQADTAFGTQVDGLLLSLLAVAREGDSRNPSDPKSPGTKASSLAAVKAYLLFTSKFGRVLPQHSWDQVLAAVLDAYPRQSGAGDGNPVTAARAELQAALSTARSKMTKVDAPSARLPEISREHLQHAEVAPLDCIWTLAYLVTQGSAATALFSSALKPVLAYISNGGLWEAGAASSVGCQILKDLRDALRVLGAQQGRERQTEFQLIQCIVALIADPTESPVPQQSQADALTALSTLLKDTQPAGVMTTPSASATGSIPEEVPVRKLSRISTQSSGYAVGEVLCVESLAKVVSRGLSSSQLTDQGVQAAKDCVGELASLIGLKPEFLDALGGTVEGLAATETKETEASLTAIRLLAPAGLRAIHDTSGDTGAGGESTSRGMEEPCPQLLFSVILQVISHPDASVQAAAHSLLQSLVGEQEQGEGGGTRTRQQVTLSVDQSQLLLSALWYSLSECSDNFPPSLFLATNSTLKLALAPHGTELQANASQLALSVRHLAVSTDTISASARRSLLTLSTAMILWLLKLNVRDSVLSLAKETLPSDPFLRCEDDGTVALLQAGNAAYASPEDRALATQQLLLLGPKESRLQPQHKFAGALAAEVVGNHESGGNVEEIANDLLTEFVPDKSLAVLRSSYLSSNDLPPSASPSVLLAPAESKPVTAQGPVAGSFAEALDNVGVTRDDSARGTMEDDVAPGLPGLDDLLKRTESQTDEGAGTGDSVQNVNQALAILAGV